MLFSDWNICVVSLSLFIGIADGWAQFSPGDLSRAHHDLEGTKNCATCHDVGQEISGTKCLTCHSPIQNQRDAKRGYHFAVADKKCTSCHKEHLGVSSRITLITPEEVDHRMTGFALTGKHASVQCAQCHNARRVKDPDVLTSLGKNPRTTYLGLPTECASCHEDRHRGKLGPMCQTCHTTSSWKDIPNFDHAKTKYPLTGTHTKVECSKCHTAITVAAKDGVADLATKPFVDCTPCHATPHSEKFSGKACASCHTTAGWKKGEASGFNHGLTAFPLLGKHAQVKCDRCHTPDAKGNSRGSLKLAHGKCTDCHSDYHEGTFARSYKNDCAKCHTVNGFSPSTFTVAQHTPVYALAGAHEAIPCVACHAKGETTKAPFRFADRSCEGCHRDPHKGEFRRFMNAKGCETCHATERWSNIRFDHSATSFRLAGKHAEIGCDRCHRVPATSPTGKMKYKGIGVQCQSCHDDIHRGQFASGGSTDCVSCHTPVSWHALVFEHDSRSSFKLTGAHAKVRCNQCHMQEMSAGKRFVRYKPLSGTCESCHKGKKL